MRAVDIACFRGASDCGFRALFFYFRGHWYRHEVNVPDHGTWSLGRVMSKVMCQGEKGWDSLHFVFVGEDSEEDAVHGGSVLEDAHGAGSAAALAEAAFDGVGGPHRLSFGEGLVAEAGEKLVEIVAQAGDRGGIGLPPALGATAGGPPGPSSR